MRKAAILTGVIFFVFHYPANAFSDPSTTAAIVHQTAVQMEDQLRNLAQLVQTVKTLESQLSNTRDLLALAQKGAAGLEGFDFVTDFRNVVLATNDLIRDVQSSINTASDLPDQWKKMFGSLDPWVRNAKELFGNIDISDKSSTSGYLVGDSYQRLYEKNADTVAQFVANAKQVNEKGALKQIAEEIAQLIQMENNTTYLLSEMLKGQSIEASNSNLKRKEEAVRFEQEHTGIKSFMHLVDDQTFRI